MTVLALPTGFRVFPFIVLFSSVIKCPHAFKTNKSQSSWTTLYLLQVWIEFCLDKGIYHNKWIKKWINEISFKYKKVSRITCESERLKECRLDKLSVKIQQGFLRHHMTKAAWTYQVITIKFTQMRNHVVWFGRSLIHNVIKKILIINSLTWMYYYYLCL